MTAGSLNRRRAQPSERAVLVREALSPLLQRLAQKQETAGVCVLGSYALSGVRPFADLNSDFDLALFIDIPLSDELLGLSVQKFQSSVQPLLPEWLPNFKFFYPDADPGGASGAPPLQINIHQLVLGFEEQRDLIWPADRREAFTNTCDLVYDPTGRISRLLESKAKPPLDEVMRRISHGLAVIPVTIEHSVEKCTLRGSLADAALALAETVGHLVDLVYALNCMDLPHLKWRLGLIDTLPVLPVDFRSRTENILMGAGISQAQFIGKIALLRELFGECRALVPASLLPKGDPYRELITEVKPGFQLRQKTSADLYAEKNLSPESDQYQRMADSTWNRKNFDLSADG